MADEKEAPEKKPTATSRTAAAKKVPVQDVPREDLSQGVLRTSRIGAIEDRARLLDPEGERHKTLAEAAKPGDDNYNPFTDPLIPTSSMQQTVYAELQGFEESPTWNALHEAEELAAKRFQALRAFEQGELAEAS